MGGTNYSSDNASSATISKEQETQQDSKLSIGLSLYYSIYKEEELDPSQNKTLGEQVKKQGSGYMNYHEEVESERISSTPNDGMEYRYVDCSGCKYDIDACKVVDSHRIKKNLFRGLNEIYELCMTYVDKSSSCDLYVNLGGYDLIEDLVCVTNYMLTGKEPKGLSDKKLKSQADGKFKDKFQQLKTNGWRFKVYTNIYSASETFAEGDEKELKEQEERRIKQENARIRAQVESGAFKDFGSGGVAYSAGVNFIENNSFSSAMHLIFGVGSLSVFFPPVALVCSFADIVMHAIEGVVAFNNNDKKGAEDHIKDAAIGVFFIIPFSKIGKFMKLKVFKVEEKIAERNLNVAQKQGRTGFESTGAQKPANKYDKIDKPSELREGDEIISKDEFKLSEAESQQSFQGKYDKAKLDYNNYNDSIKDEFKIKSHITLEELLEDLKKEWKDNHFLSISKNTFRITNKGVTTKGIINIITPDYKYIDLNAKPETETWDQDEYLRDRYSPTLLD